MSFTSRQQCLCISCVIWYLTGYNSRLFGYSGSFAIYFRVFLKIFEIQSWDRFDIWFFFPVLEKFLQVCRINWLEEIIVVLLRIGHVWLTHICLLVYCKFFPTHCSAFLYLLCVCRTSVFHVWKNMRDLFDDTVKDIWLSKRNAYFQ